MEATEMLHVERFQWRQKEDMYLQHLADNWHWKNNADDYDASLQEYYQARFSHQQHTYRLNQVLYGTNISSALRSNGSQPQQTDIPHSHAADDMCCSPTPNRQPLRAHEHNSMMASPQANPNFDRKRKPDDCGFVWSAQWSKKRHQQWWNKLSLCLKITFKYPPFTHLSTVQLSFSIIHKPINYARVYSTRPT